MELRKIPVCLVIGYLVNPAGFTLANAQGDQVVIAGMVGCCLLTAARRDTHLRAEQ